MESVKTFALNLDTEEKHYAYSINKKAYSTLHNHDDFYEITIVTDGSVGHHINDIDQILTFGTVIYLRPQDIHYLYDLNSTEFEYINLAFTSKTLTDLLLYVGSDFNLDYFNNAPLPPTIQLSSMDVSIIRRNVEQFSIIPIEDATHNRKKMLFRLIIADLFYKYIQTTMEETLVQPLWLKDLLYEMNNPDNFSQGIPRLEELSGKSSSYICRTFKEYLQITPTEYINDQRLNYCANWLIHSDMEIIDIAMDAGFNNLSHFYHLFKEKYHVSPKQYRKANQNLI